MEDEVYSNHLPNEAVRVISENDPGFKMMLLDLLSLSRNYLDYSYEQGEIEVLTHQSDHLHFLSLYGNQNDRSEAS